MAARERFILVSSALALCAVVALFALAADQYEDISTSELASKDAVVALKAMLDLPAHRLQRLLQSPTIILAEGNSPT